MHFRSLPLLFLLLLSMSMNAQDQVPIQDVVHKINLTLIECVDRFNSNPDVVHIQQAKITLNTKADAGGESMFLNTNTVASPSAGQIAYVFQPPPPVTTEMILGGRSNAYENVKPDAELIKRIEACAKNYGVLRNDGVSELMMRSFCVEFCLVILPTESGDIKISAVHTDASNRMGKMHSLKVQFE